MSWEFKSPHPHFSADDSSQDHQFFEIIASKVGKLIESLTSDAYDLAKVEDILIGKLIENLAAEGIRGEVASVRGLDLEGKELRIESGLNVRHHQPF